MENKQTTQSLDAAFNSMGDHINAAAVYINNNPRPKMEKLPENKPENKQKRAALSAANKVKRDKWLIGAGFDMRPILSRAKVVAKTLKNSASYKFRG